MSNQPGLIGPAFLWGVILRHMPSKTPNSALFPSLFLASIMLSGCASRMPAEAGNTEPRQQVASNEKTIEAKTPETSGQSLPDGEVFPPDKVVALLPIPEKVGKLELEYVFRYADSSQGELYLYGGDVLMRPEVGILPFEARLEALMKSTQQKDALRLIYQGLRKQLVTTPEVAAPESMRVSDVEFLREELREATWVRRDENGNAIKEETMPAIFSVYDIRFADGDSARSYFWLTEISGHMLRIKMTEHPYPGLEGNFLSFARQVMTSVIRNAPDPTIEPAMEPNAAAE